MPPTPSYNTSDLCDAYGEALQVADPVFNDYGGRLAFHGPIATIKVDQEVVPTRETLQTPGDGRVLVIDGGASTATALLGDLLAEMALNNGWAGVVINGCVRDAVQLSSLAIGVKARNTCPRRPGPGDTARREVEVSFAGVVFRPGEHLYADRDGVVVSAAACALPPG